MIEWSRDKRPVKILEEKRCFIIIQYLTNSYPTLSILIKRKFTHFDGPEKRACKEIEGKGENSGKQPFSPFPTTFLALPKIDLIM